MDDRKCPQGHDREKNCPYLSCGLARTCTLAPKMKVGRLDGFEFVLSEPATGPTVEDLMQRRNRG